MKKVRLSPSVVEGILEDNDDLDPEFRRELEGFVDRGESFELEMGEEEVARILLPVFLNMASGVVDDMSDSVLEDVAEEFEEERWDMIYFTVEDFVRVLRGWPEAQFPSRVYEGMVMDLAGRLEDKSEGAVIDEGDFDVL